MGYMMVPVEGLTRGDGAFLDSFFSKTRVTGVVIIFYTTSCLLAMFDKVEKKA